LVAEADEALRRLQELQAVVDREARYSEGRFAALRIAQEDLRAMMGRMLVNQQSRRPAPLAEMEFKVYSQWGDDGIIQYLIHQIADLPRIFIEFGVEDYNEANTRFLLVNDNWRGLIMDSSEAYIRQAQADGIHWRHDLTARAAFVTADNVNELIASAGFSGEIGLLHIDIDGNDYWVWQALSIVNPVIAIVEYNSVFGAGRPVSIPYQPDFDRTRAHHSNLYFGASLAALCRLADAKGYAFVGCNSAGNNAYFVRWDRIGALQPLSVDQGYVRSAFRESRDEQGNLTFVGGEQRLELIRGLPVVNVETGQTETL
jgi:hypothetical protein